MKDQLNEFMAKNKIYSHQGSNGLFYAWKDWSCEWDYLGNQGDGFGEGQHKIEAIKNLCLIKGVKIPQWMSDYEENLNVPSY